MPSESRAVCAAAGAAVIAKARTSVRKRMNTARGSRVRECWSRRETIAGRAGPPGSGLASAHLASAAGVLPRARGPRMSVQTRCARVAAAISIAAAVAMAAGSCGSNSTGPKPTSVIFNGGQNQSAAKGTTLPINPSVQVLDPQFNGVQNFRVVFAVASGGGSSTGDTVLTDVNGIAAVGSWTLGPNPGTNTLTASAQGLQGSPLTFTATGN